MERTAQESALKYNRKQVQRDLSGQVKRACGGPGADALTKDKRFFYTTVPLTIHQAPTLHQTSTLPCLTLNGIGDSAPSPKED